MTDDMGINLAGAEVVLKLTERMAQMENEINRLREEVRRLRPSSNPGGEVQS